MIVKALIELKAASPPGVGPLYYTKGPSGLFGWTSVAQDALGFESLHDAQAFMQEGFLVGVAEAREHKFLDVPPR